MARIEILILKMRCRQILDTTVVVDVAPMAAEGWTEGVCVNPPLWVIA